MGALELTRHGHNVVVEQGAGEEAFPDLSYNAVGAQIGSVEEVLGGLELVLKVKEPILEEFGRLRRARCCSPISISRRARSSRGR